MKWFVVTLLVLGVVFMAGRLSTQLPASAEEPGGLEPCTTLNGDADGDGKLGLADVVRLAVCILAPYRCPGGPVPICPDPMVAELEADLATCTADLENCQAGAASTCEKVWQVWALGWSDSERQVLAEVMARLDCLDAATQEELVSFYEFGVASCEACGGCCSPDLDAALEEAVIRIEPQPTAIPDLF